MPEQLPGHGGNLPSPLGLQGEKHHERVPVIRLDLKRLALMRRRACGQYFGDGVRVATKGLDLPGNLIKIAVAAMTG